MQATIVLLPGDGIGREVVREARRVLEMVAARYGHSFSFQEHLIGGCSIDAHGTALTDDVLAACQAADAVLLGAVGGPQWSDPAAPVRPEQGLLRLRKEMGLFANLRPVRAWPELAESSPLKADRTAGVDILFVRELTSGVYFGAPRYREDTPTGVRAVDTMAYTELEIRRVARLAFRLAEGRRGLLTSVDKANVLESSRLWRQVVSEVAGEHPAVTLEHHLVDSMAMRLVQRPASLDVVVTTNLFGDILSDEASVLAGALGMLPSAALGEPGAPGVYEPIHGSAPDIAGQGRANPIGTILSAAMLLRESLGLDGEADAVEQAVGRVIARGVRTADLGGRHTTGDMGREVRAELAAAS